MLGGMLAAVWSAFVVGGCASVQPASYSLQDGEIFIASHTHFLNVAVAVLEDRRSAEEKAWAAQRNLPSNLTEIVTERMLEHLRVSHVFSRIQEASGPINPSSSDRIRDLGSQGIDAVLFGELVHFYGQTDSNGRIEGHVQFVNLRLLGTRSGQLLWEGTSDKLLRRQEKQPRLARDYAAEALRGAINQLAMQLAAQAFSDAQTSLSDRPEMRHWRVGVPRPEDARPPEEKDGRDRKLKGDQNYALYNDPAGGVQMLDEVPNQWAKNLRDLQIFGEVVSVHDRGAGSEALRKWSEEGLDAVLTSRLTRLFALVIPPRDERPFPIWSGGMGYPRLFKATALVRFEDVELIETQSGKVIWKGQAEDGIDRMLKTWELPAALVRESLDETLARLAKQLSDFVSSSNEKSFLFNGSKDLSPS